jgi:hypothetical protein
VPATFEKIASTTLSSPALSITFSSISQDYTDLQVHLRCKAASTNGQHIYVRMGNGSVDTNNIYANQSLFDRGSPSPATSGDWSSSFLSSYYIPYASYISSASNNFSALQFYVFNYSATNTKKAVQSLSNTVTGNNNEYPAIEFSNAMINTSAAINIIEFRHSNSAINLDTGTSITIYGIKKA